MPDQSTAVTLTSAERRAILAEQYRIALTDIARRNGHRNAETGRTWLSGAQIAAAKGVARKRALAIIDSQVA